MVKHIASEGIGMLMADEALDAHSAHSGMPVVAHGRPAVITYVATNLRINQHKPGGVSRRVTLQYQDGKHENRILTLPDPAVRERLIDQEVFAQVEKSLTKLIQVRGIQRERDLRLQEYKSGFPEVFEAIEAKAAANNEEREAATAVRRLAAEWIDGYGGEAKKLPQGLTAKNFRKWEYNQDAALGWAVAHQPGLVSLTQLTEAVITRIVEDERAYAAFCTLIEAVPELFTVEDERMQSLLDGVDYLTHASLEARKVTFTKVEIASKLGR